LKMVESTITLHEQLTQALSVYKNYCGDASELWEQLKYLQSRLTLFVDKRDSRHKLEKEQEGLRVAVESLDKQVLEKKALAAVVKEGLVGLQNQLMALTKQRQDLFGDQSVQSAEEQARKQLKSSEELLQRGMLEQKQLTARREALEVNIVKEKEAFTTLHANQQLLQEQLRTQLAKLGFPTIEQAAAHILSEETHQHLTEQWELLKNSQTSIRQSVNDLTAQYTGLTKEKQSDQSESELNTSIFGQDQQITAQGQRIGIITERLHRDQENTRKLADKIKGKEQQEMEYHRWKQLSDLIGDATGNTFSKFAQELTLQQVMRLANEHLKRLSDRYLIKHVKQENMDELFIVDTYHGNAERSVKTLSGGESFLVSLSLALGLSDLAGKNTLIGSLFIDEGFGTLDQNTLDVALSSLEKLQNETNRTIGIISHVPALKERVTTQIELVKDASGYSTLVIRS